MKPILIKSIPPRMIHLSRATLITPGVARVAIFHDICNDYFTYAIILSHLLLGNSKYPARAVFDQATRLWRIPVEIGWMGQYVDEVEALLRESDYVISLDWC